MEETQQLGKTQVGSTVLQKEDASAFTLLIISMLMAYIVYKFVKR